MINRGPKCYFCARALGDVVTVSMYDNADSPQRTTDNTPCCFRCQETSRVLRERKARR